MPTNSPIPNGEFLDEVLEATVFSDPDPRVQRQKARWEKIQREVRELFEGECRKQHEYRLDYHRTCGAADAVTQALRDLALIRPMLVEKREQRLCLLWQDIYRKVAAVLQQLRDEKAELLGPEASSTNP